MIILTNPITVLIQSDHCSCLIRSFVAANQVIFRWLVSSLFGGVGFVDLCCILAHETGYSALCWCYDQGRYFVFFSNQIEHKVSRQRVSMRKIRSVLRYHFGEDYSIRKTARYSLLSFSMARDYVLRAKQAGLGWPLPEGMTDAELSSRLFLDSTVSNPRHPAPDWEVIHKTLDRKEQTLQMAHERYLQVYPGGYSYSRFCALYRAWCNRKEVVMRQTHEPGENHTIELNAGYLASGTYMYRMIATGLESRHEKTGLMTLVK